MQGEGSYIDRMQLSTMQKVGVEDQRSMNGSVGFGYVSGAQLAAMLRASQTVRQAVPPQRPMPKAIDEPRETVAEKKRRFKRLKKRKVR